jgi:glycosyltransferase involved in cell wall biosynthesis
MVVAAPRIPSAVLLVDLTPMLPGGANGGAKWFVLSLLDGLCSQNPGWEFCCLIRTSIRDELAQRFPRFTLIPFIADAGGETVTVPFPLLPDGRRPNMLFCPFTAPFYWTPGMPTVSIVYDLQFAFYPQFFPPEALGERSGHFQRATQVAQRLVCISDFVRDTVIDLARLPPEQVETVHISLPDRLPTCPPEEAVAVLARLGLTARRYLLFPANCWAHKNHRMLLTAFGIFRARHPDSDLKLVCTGVSDDVDGERLKLACRQMGLAGHVLFSGFLPETALAALTTNARALIFPSLYEGFGMPVLEAMAQGTPVLCSNVTSLPEVAGNAAVLFDPRKPDDIATAIARIDTNGELAVRLARDGRERARHFGDADDMAAAYGAILSEVMGYVPTSPQTAVAWWIWTKGKIKDRLRPYKRRLQSWLKS